MASTIVMTQQFLRQSLAAAEHMKKQVAALEADGYVWAGYNSLVKYDAEGRAVSWVSF